ncbi:hypothetical protein AAFN47_25535 [Hoeflea sp. CAU 1731]
MLIELAWCWLKYQPQSRLTQWYQSHSQDAEADLEMLVLLR